MRLCSAIWRTCARAAAARFASHFTGGRFCSARSRLTASNRNFSSPVGTVCEKLAAAKRKIASAKKTNRKFLADIPNLAADADRAEAKNYVASGGGLAETHHRTEA